MSPAVKDQQAVSKNTNSAEKKGPVEKVASKKAAENKSEKPEKPDEEASKARQEAVTKEIEEKKNEVTTLIGKIKEKREKASGLREQKQGIQKQFEDALEVVKGLRGERQALIARSKELRDAQRADARDLKDAQKNFQKMGEDSHKAEIAKLEYQHHTATMTLNEEKIIMKNIATLKRQLPQAQKVAAELEAKEAKAEASNAALQNKGTIEEQIKALDTELEAKNLEVDKIKAARVKLNEDIDKRMEGRDELNQKVDTLKEEIKKKVEERNKIRDEFREKSKAFNMWEKEQREAKRAAVQAAWEKEQAVWKLEELEQKLQQPSPHFDEMLKIEQTIEYCTSLLPKEEVEQEAEKKEFEFDAPNAKMIMAKKDRETEMYFAATKSKKKGKGARNQGGKSGSLKHTAETIKIFSDLKLSVPMSISDLADIKESLQAQLEKVKEKDAAWKLEIKQEVEQAKKSSTAELEQPESNSNNAE